VTDNITLPREVVEKIREAWSSEVYPPAASIEWYDIMDALRAALEAALAEPERHVSLVCPQCNWTLQEQEPEKERAETVIPARCVAGSEKPASQRDESYRTTEPPAKPEPVAWMESPHGAIRANPLYRITAPQSLAWSIPLYAAPPAATREPATVGQVIAASGPPWAHSATPDFFTGFRAAERFHGITKEDKL